MARQQPKQDRDDSTVVRSVIRRARDSMPVDSAKPVQVPVDDDDHGGTRVLPDGTRLAEFEIVKLIGEGGSGIVYLAYDHCLDRHVAIKEYMPSSMASRSRTLHVSARSKDQTTVFKAGLRNFVNESRLLAQFDSPSLVKVFRFWESNNTAYMVMPFYEGSTLKQAYKEHKIIPSEEWIKIFLVNLCDALEMIHRACCYHRDIAPDNILVLPNGQPLLLDFGAARKVINDRTQGPTGTLKPGFAPIEQYANIAELKQGPWTDVYALGAVVYYLMTGKAPVPAVARYVNDDMVPAREAGRKRYSAGFLAAIDHALAVRPDQRPQSIAELRSALGINGDVPRTMPPMTVVNEEKTQRVAPHNQPRREPRIQLQNQTNKESHTGQHTEQHNASRTEPRIELRIELRIEPHFTPVDWPVQPDFTPRTQSAALNPSRMKIGAVVLALLLAIGAGLTYWQMQTNPTDQAGPSVSLRANGVQESFRPIGPRSATTPSMMTDTQADTLPNPRQIAVPALAAGSPKMTLSTPAPASPTRYSGTAEANAMSPSDAALWKDAVTIRTASAYQRYLDQYPQGRHARQTAERLAKLQPQKTLEPTSSAAILLSESQAASAPTRPDSKVATAAGEPAVWSQANQTHDRPGYETYLAAFPNGPHARTALNRLETLKQKPPAEPAIAIALPPSQAILPAPALKVAASESPQATGTRTDGIAAASSKVTPTEPPIKSAKLPSNVPSNPAANLVVARDSDISALGISTTIRVAGQTFIGNFTVDPANGIVSGSGRVTWSNGDRFDGTMVNGIKQGQGEFAWASGQRYKGSWAQDLPNGSGFLHFANGNEYVGQVRDGTPTGKGALQYAGGGKYQGGFSSGLPDGIGVSAFKNGDAYDGHWIKGKSNGHGKYTWANGEAWEGEFRNDQRTTNGKIVSAGVSGVPGSAAAGNASDIRNPSQTN